MTSELQYQYEEIRQPCTIRLLYLHQGNDSEAIRFSLSTVSLDDHPAYEAISYCWGDPSIVQKVICEDAWLSPTVSLCSALVAFRLPDRTRVLWADALCIDQRNNDEKSGQLLLMPRIYSQAERVLIWLGPEDGDLDGVDNTIRHALDFLPDSTYDIAELGPQSQAVHYDMMKRHREGLPSLLSNDWQPLVHLLRRPWFCRKWVVQETSLAREAVIFAGRFEIPWNDLGYLLLMLESISVIQTALLLQENHEDAKGEGPAKVNALRGVSDMIRPMHNTSIISAIKLYREHAVLFDCVVATSTFSCTDDRDHVYALLSLPKRPLPLVPDYSADAGEIFRRFAELEMVETNSLKLLGLAPDKLSFSRASSKRLNIPTWVPDLRRLGEVDTLVSYNVKEQIFHAGGSSKPIFSISECRTILECRGRYFDTVKAVAKTYLEPLLADQPESRSLPIGQIPVHESLGEAAKHTGRWAVNCHELAGKPLDAVPFDLERSRAFSRTMVCGMVGMRDPLSTETVDAFPHLMRRLAASAGGVSGTAPTHQPDLHRFIVSLESSLQGTAIVRRFCVTETGRFGQLPFDAEVGDHLWVLTGAEVPFVVRPQDGGRYRLIGECYVDGVMNGEVLEAGEYTTQQIRIE